MENLQFILHENVDNFGLSETPKTTLGYKFEKDGKQYGDYIVIDSPSVTVSDVMDGLGVLCRSIEKTLYASEKLEKNCCTPDSEAVRYDSPFRETVEKMLSANYKERFKAEYQQTKIRYEKLKALNNRIEAAFATNYRKNCVEMPVFDCPQDMLREQQKVMGQYLHILEVRAVIEGIDLTSI